MSRQGAVLLLAVVLVILPLAFLLGFGFSASTSISTLQTPPEPIVVSARESETVVSREVLIVPSWGDPPTVPAPRLEGIVTGVFIVPGDRISSGDDVVEIDGIRRMALHTERPFWRGLTVGDVGEDVAMLRSSLASIGVASSDDSEGYSPDLANAVAAWASDLGVSQVDGSFDPSWIVWLPTQEFIVGDVHIGRGDIAPGLGEAIASGPPALLGAQLEEPNGGPVQLAEGTWEVDFADRRFAVELGTAARISDEELTRLAPLLSGPDPQGATLRQREVRRSVTLPATAVSVGSHAQFCVWIVDGNSYEPIAVVPGDASFSTVAIADGISPGATVLANPREVLENPECP